MSEDEDTKRIIKRLERRLKKYKLPVPRFYKMFLLQYGICGICEDSNWTVIDHDHDTGKVRGLLCSPCNLVLGHAKDNQRILRSAADYLDRAESYELYSTWKDERVLREPKWVVEIAYGKGDFGGEDNDWPTWPSSDL